MQELIILFGGIFLGSMVGYFIANRRVNRLQTASKTLIDRYHSLELQHATLKKEYDLTRAHHEEKIDLLQDTKAQLEKDFTAITQKLYEERSRAFEHSNQKNLQQLLMPFKEQIAKFEKQVSEVYRTESQERAVLKNELATLQQLNVQMRQDAINLTQALKGENKRQGNWGEVVLERVLEESGLRAGHEYELQAKCYDQEGKRYAPDVIVHLPNKRDIVIDSKVSLVSYERFTSSEDKIQKEQALQAHLVSIRQHIDGLSSKRYENLLGVNSLDFVLLFMPVEGAFLTALQADDTLFTKAFSQNIVIVSPSTLLVTLRTIENMWGYEYQNQNALEIANKAGQLYDKFVSFVQDVEKIGTQLNRTQSSYDDALKKLSTGNGNLINRAQQLKALGVKGKKELSQTASFASSDE